MIDSHCHLNLDTHSNQHKAAIAEANATGVHTIINVGIDLASSRAAIDLSEQHDGLFATVGVHPHDAKTLCGDTLDKLRTMAGHDKVVAIGEIGLDYYRDLSPRQVQREAFLCQLELAIEVDLPIVIHTRESFDDTVKIVSQYASRLRGGVFHCFPGNADDAATVIGMGFVISVGGVITFPKASMARMAQATDLGKIILETDSPYLTPVPFRGKPNKPAYVRHVCNKLAELKEIGPSDVERVTDRTCQKLFRLVETFEG